MATLDGSLPPASAPARPAGARSQSSKRSDSPATARTASRRLVVDRVARWVVTGGGMAIIASILGILFFILLEVLPLTRSARIEVGASVAVSHPVEALTVDEYQTHAALLAPGGNIQIVRLADGAVVAERQLLGEGLLAARVPPGGTAVTASTSDGRVIAQTIDWRAEFATEAKYSELGH